MNIWLNSSFLFAVTVAAGLAAFRIPKISRRKFNLILSFSGAYLLAVTVIHIIPELFVESGSTSGQTVGLFILIGFLFQTVLEYFSKGVEHGHIHIHHSSKEGHHTHGSVFSASILISLLIHAFLEGTLLTHPHHAAVHETGANLLAAITIHKVPEAFALIAVLLNHGTGKPKTVFFLLLLAVASPLGMFMSRFTYLYFSLEGHIFSKLFALVTGGFLHISATIFFETDPQHRFRVERMLFLLAGATAATIPELFF